MLQKDPFINVVNTLKKSGNYRVFNDILRKAGDYPHAIWYSKYNIKNVINWCSNDYLGMSQHKVVIDAMKTALDETGAGSGGTRNISGTSHYHVALERELATWHKKDTALLYTSAFVANEWTLISLKKIVTDVEFVSDSLNHASLVQGIINSQAPRHIFRHNDLEDLEDKLKQIKGTPCIVFESVYSMDGDVGYLKEICDLADKYNAITYCDEVHAVGLYGEQGSGVLEQRNLIDRVDIVSGALGKAVGTHGGYIAGDAEVIDAIRCVSAGFIFTTSLSPVVCAGSAASIKYLRDKPGQELRAIHQKKAKQLKQLMRDAKIEIFENETHLVPVMIKDPIKCKFISDQLLEKYDIYVQPINYPSVPKGTERLRFAPTPFHTDAMLSELVVNLQEIIND